MRHVLVVDDEYEALKEQFSDAEGFVVDDAGGANVGEDVWRLHGQPDHIKAIDAIRRIDVYEFKKRYEIVLLDVMFPNGDGGQVPGGLSVLRELWARHSEFPVILFTGFTKEEINLHLEDVEGRGNVEFYGGGGGYFIFPKRFPSDGGDRANMFRDLSDKMAGEIEGTYIGAEARDALERVIGSERRIRCSDFQGDLRDEVMKELRERYPDRYNESTPSWLAGCLGVSYGAVQQVVQATKRRRSVRELIRKERQAANGDR